MQIKTLNVENLTREQIRSKTLKTWEAESIGSGQYRYNVEQCKDGSLIYLLRPASLNKGCDFKILSENFKKWKNGNDKAPKHDDVNELLQQILHDDITLKADLISAIGRIYNCENLDRVLSDYPKCVIIINYGQSYPRISQTPANRRALYPSRGSRQPPQ